MLNEGAHVERTLFCLTNLLIIQKDYAIKCLMYERVFAHELSILI